MDKPKKVSKAPPPITPIRRNAAASNPAPGATRAPFTVVIPNGGNMSADELADCWARGVAEGQGSAPHPDNLLTIRNILRQAEASGTPALMELVNRRGFGVGLHILPDWSEWRHITKAEDWKAVALSLNIDPNHLRHAPLGWMAGEGAPHVILDSFPTANMGTEFAKRLRMLRALPQHPPGAAIGLVEFAGWAVHVGLDIPDELRQLVPAPRDPSVDEVGRLAEMASDEDLAMPPELWAYWFAFEMAERNGWDYATRTAANIQFERMFEANSDTLPLHQYPSTLRLPKGQPLPPKWSKGCFMPKAELRTWAREYVPDLLGSALLAEPQPAPAEQTEDATTPRQPAQQPAPEDDAPTSVGSAAHARHHAPPAQGETHDAHPLTREQIALAFGGCWKTSHEWNALLSKRIPQWLEPAIEVRAKARSKVGHRWNPVRFAELLRDRRQVDAKMLNRAFRTRDELEAWREAWQRAQSAFDQVG